MSSELPRPPRLEAAIEFLNGPQGHSFTFAPTAPWVMGDDEENEATLRLYPSDMCAEGFCASCNLYLIVDLRYSREELPWSVVPACDEVRSANNKHPRDAMRNDGRALTWAAYHGLAKMRVNLPAGHLQGGLPPMRWYARPGTGQAEASTY